MLTAVLFAEEGEKVRARLRARETARRQALNDHCARVLDHDVRRALEAYPAPWMVYRSSDPMPQWQVIVQGDPLGVEPCTGFSLQLLSPGSANEPGNAMAAMRATLLDRGFELVYKDLPPLKPDADLKVLKVRVPTHPAS